MDLRSHEITYEGPDGPLVGKVYWDGNIQSPRPGVLVASTFRGRTAFEDARAEELAALGYIGFAIDFYGEGRNSHDPEVASAWMQACDADRPLFVARVEAALATLKALDIVDETRTAGIGFCLGGKAVLDLARQGSDINGVALFHGVLDRAASTPKVNITANVLVMHGWDDPLALPADVVTLGAELSRYNAPWQLNAYGGVGHAFTNPGAKPGVKEGFGFDVKATARSWRALIDFLADCMRVKK